MDTANPATLQAGGEDVPITDVIRDAIRQRLLPPGTPLVQSAIAEALGVSRIPVREALQYLASEGLVTFTDDGARVTSLPAEQVYELWTLRALIEPAMAEATVRNIGPSELAELRALVEAMDGTADGDEWSDLNYAFHLAMYRAARQPHFAGVAARVLTQIEPYSRVAVRRVEGQQAAQAEHREMIAALGQRDGERLREVLERSSTRVRELTVDWPEDRPASPPHATSKTSRAARSFATRLLPAPVAPPVPDD